jgi:hypothetical protein
MSSLCNIRLTEITRIIYQYYFRFENLTMTVEKFMIIAITDISSTFWQINRQFLWHESSFANHHNHEKLLNTLLFIDLNLSVNYVKIGCRKEFA